MLQSHLKQAVTQAATSYPSIMAYLHDDALNMLTVVESVKATDPRDPFERRLFRKLMSFLRIAEEQVIELLGSPPDLTKITPEFMQLFREGLQEVLEPELERTASAFGLNLQSDTQIFVNWDVFSQQVVDWAEQHTFDTVTGITQTTVNRLQRAIPSFFNEGLTRQELEDRILASGIQDIDVFINGRIRRIYATQRAEMIAVTETTRAAAEGEKIAAQQIMRENPDVIMTPTWNTNADELVCPICGPRNQQEIKPGNATGGTFPPAHVNCRCFVTHEASLRNTPNV